MVKHANFYQTLSEARMRLRDTIVMYKNEPYWVMEVIEDPNDNKFRVYMDPLGKKYVGREAYPDWPVSMAYSNSAYKDAVDSFIANTPECKIIRKFANSKHFNNFRPFPLGNMNVSGEVVYCERTPTRNMQQGMLPDAVTGTRVTVASSRTKNPLNSKYTQGRLGDFAVECLTPEFYDMLMGSYPSYKEVVENLLNPEVLNVGCAFHREWSVMRGPVDMLCLCYQHQGIGLIDPDTNNVRLGKEFSYLAESLEELNIFNDIQFKKELINDAN